MTFDLEKLALELADQIDEPASKHRCAEIIQRALIAAHTAGRVEMRREAADFAHEFTVLRGLVSSISHHIRNLPDQSPSTPDNGQTS
jgi:hypothetical protein